MIHIIAGAKGSGKTKKIIDVANTTGSATKGEVVFITDTMRYSLDIKHMIRLINTEELRVKGLESFLGMIKGLIAGNGDITDIFIDGLARIINMDIEDMQECYKLFEKLANEHSINFTITVSSDTLPPYIDKYDKIA